MLKFFLIFLLFTGLYAKELQRNYYIDSKKIKLSDIIDSTSLTEDRTILQLHPTQHLLRVKSKELLQLLKQHGITQYTTKYPYIQFNETSPIDTQPIAKKIAKYYHEKYADLNIKHIEVQPRRYISSLPKKYSIEIRSQEYLNKEGLVSVKTIQNKQIFFNYTIDATLNIFKTTKKIDREDELTRLNTTKESIILENFRALPLQQLENSVYQAKHTMKPGELITLRDIESLSLIRRGSSVNVNLQNGSIVINFSAKALQNGKKGDSIFVENDKGKKIKVLVTGKNKAKVK